MKKSYYIYMFNTVSKLGVFCVLMLLLGVAMSILKISLIELKTGMFETLINDFIYWIDLSIYLEKMLNNFLIIIVVVIILIEVFNRFILDSILNLFKSIIGTIKFRSFLKQNPKPLFSETDSLTISENETISKFNRTINKSVLDLTNKELKLVIKVPNQIQASKILKDCEESISEYIGSMYPKYIISSLEKNKNKLYLAGTRKR